MLQHVILFTIALLIEAVVSPCPSEAQIYGRGITNQGKVDVVTAHNQYRLMIAHGSVPGQPKGINLKRMVYDEVLGIAGRVVSNTCELKHKPINSTTFRSVGQNLYISWESRLSSTQDWLDVVKRWYEEYTLFVYPYKIDTTTGHYTQLVWADTTNVGCDFISFFDKTRPKFPYAKLYTCNYGPGGNFPGVPPYKTGTSGCENLC